MKKNDDLFSSISDLLTDGVFLYDLKRQRVQYANAAGTTLTGIHTDDTADQILKLWQQVMPQDRAYVSAQYHEALKKPVSQSAEFTLIRDGEEKKYLHATACVLEDRQLLTVYVRDITKLKEHEDYLVEFGAKKNTLLDTLTHNLSGSLNLTKHLAAQASKRVSTDDELTTYIRLMTENNEASLKIVEDFLLYEHEKSPRIQIKATRINIVEKVGFVYQQLKNSYPDRTIDLTSEQPELHVTTDEVKLLQIVNNLTSNAIKFSQPEKPIVIHLEAKSDSVTISVSDQGIGIPESMKPLIFLRQPTTGRTGLTGEPSHGQGLAICKHLTEMIEGSISFESTEGQGSTFTITLPHAMKAGITDGQTGIV